MDKQACFYCGRSIGINPVTYGLRRHNWPKDKVTTTPWITPGQRCPGTGQAGL